MYNIQLYTFATLGVLMFLMVTDENLAKLVYLRINLAIINIRRYYLLAMLHPNNKLTKWWFNYKLMKSIKKHND